MFHQISFHNFLAVVFLNGVCNFDYFFDRNLPYTIENEEVEEFFSQFGDVKYARVVIDKNSGMSKGNYFSHNFGPAKKKFFFSPNFDKNRLLGPNFRSARSFIFFVLTLDLSGAIFFTDFRSVMEEK